MKLYPFSSRLAATLAHPPTAGAGRHFWLWDVCHGLLHAGLPIERVGAYAGACIAEYGWTDRKKDVTDILVKLGNGGDAYTPPARRIPLWPAPSESARRAVAAGTKPIFNPLQATALATRDVLPLLFADEDLICVGWTFSRYTTDTLLTLLPQAHQAEFIVANPMTATADSAGSKRSGEIACPWSSARHIVVEFDTGDTLTDQAAVLSHLSSRRHPLILAVWSGGKSIHGWYDASGLTFYEKLVFFRYAVYLGADRSLWDRAKLVRMPGGRRANGAAQYVLYFNPTKGAHTP